MPRIAAAAYPLSPLADWAAYEAKLERWIIDAAGAELLVFPEYGGAEIATIGGDGWGEDHFGAIDAITARLDQADDILARLAARHGVWIVAGSVPVREDGRILNRARLIGPVGERGVQDKLMPTRWEREALGMAGGDVVRMFETPVGCFGISTCYDSEFPLIARMMVEAGAEVILAPSCTETEAGYWRVRIGAMARALEGAVLGSPCAADREQRLGGDGGGKHRRGGGIRPTGPGLSFDRRGCHRRDGCSGLGDP